MIHECDLPKLRLLKKKNARNVIVECEAILTQFLLP